jgi:hypothetical protein
MIEVAGPGGGQHARRGGEGVAGVAQEDLDRAVAREARLERAEPGPRLGDLGRDLVVDAWQLAAAAGEEPALDLLTPGEQAQHPDRALRLQDLAGDLAEERGEPFRERR